MACVAGETFLWPIHMGNRPLRLPMSSKQASLPAYLPDFQPACLPDAVPYPSKFHERPESTPITLDVVCTFLHGGLHIIQSVLRVCSLQSNGLCNRSVRCVSVEVRVHLL